MARLSRLNQMYRERGRMALLGVSHLAIVADPATHSKRECMMSLIWSSRDRFLTGPLP